jgi:gliding motility-associated-like protein
MNVTGATATITIRNSPRAKLTGTTICAGDPAIFSFTATEGSPPFNIKYSDGINFYDRILTTANTSFSHPVMLTDTTGFALVSISDNNGCSNDFAFVPNAFINVRPLPQGGITGQSVCIDDSARITFNALNGNGPFAVTISNGTNEYYFTGIINKKTFTLPEKVTSSGNAYTLAKIKEELNPGCERNSGFQNATAIATAVAKPVIDFPAIHPVCENEPAFLLDDVKELSGLAGTWRFSGKGISAAGNFLPSLAATGNHTITYSYTSTQGCTATARQNIQVNAIPAANAGADQVICPNSIGQLHAIGGESYSWSPATGLSNPAIANPVVTPSINSTYTVTVTSAAGCSATDEIAITVSPVNGNTFRMPNAFTPNNDGKSDCFGISKLHAIKVNEFAVYNRWGNKVFSTTNPQACWDGTYKGKPQANGGYVYMLNAVTGCGNVNTKGTVLLLR